eukprot:m.802447 g.802447  ORF g.802447 m.802447 type:complete len:441 (+) comp59274_c0_seq23:384-1706(+)
MQAVPVWMFLRSTGLTAIQAAIRGRLAEARALRSMLVQFPVLAITGDSLVSGAALAFAIDPSRLPALVAICQSSGEVNVWNDVNEQLFVAIQSSAARQLDLEIIYLGDRRFVRFQAFKHAGASSTSSSDVQALNRVISTLLESIESTIKLSAKFPLALAGVKSLKHVASAPTLSLGSFQYIPRYLEGYHSEQVLSEISRLNQELYDSLRSRQSSGGELLEGVFLHFNIVLDDATLGTSYVSIGLPSRPLDDAQLGHLVQAISKVGDGLPVNEELLNSFTLAVKQGIDKAQKELEAESQARLFEEGILRHVPIVGDLLNWFAPPAPRTAAVIPGRSFNLASGVVERHVLTAERTGSSQSSVPVESHDAPPAAPTETPVTASETTPVTSGLGDLTLSCTCPTARELFVSFAEVTADSSLTPSASTASASVPVQSSEKNDDIV